ncbi:hypothetical protein MJK72_04735 [Klebsiella pneumoniae]|nr:hypothetical protein MJK72_04735 [Klebsiella pneumoniae]
MADAVILAKGLVDSVLKRANITDSTVLGTVQGDALGTDALQTPVPELRRSGDSGRLSHVTLSAGTGAVHTAGSIRS